MRIGQLEAELKRLQWKPESVERMRGYTTDWSRQATALERESTSLSGETSRLEAELQSLENENRSLKDETGCLDNRYHAAVRRLLG